MQLAMTLVGDDRNWGRVFRRLAIMPSAIAPMATSSKLSGSGTASPANVAPSLPSANAVALKSPLTKSGVKLDGLTPAAN